MNRQFSLFQSHLDLAQEYWSYIIDNKSVVIDCTCGNGYDAAYLASLNPLKLYGLDIQEEALKTTQKKLSESSCDVIMLQQCHSQFPKEIKEDSVDLIVYNLGYLPGGDKTLTTRVDTTLQSLNEACRLLKPGGVISVTCYPGHPEGAKEDMALMDWGKTLDPAMWCFTSHRFANRKKSPSLILIQKNALSS